VQRQGLPALNVASALEVTRGQFKETADPYQIERRIESCKKCPYFQADLCNRCGCYVAGKVGAKHERCPINRW